MKILSSIEVNADLKNLYEIRQVISKDAQPFFASEKDVFGIVLSTDEICSNIIRHAYHHNPEQRFKVSTFVEATSFLVVIEHVGIAYDLLMHQPPQSKSIVDNKQKGGYGIIIAKKNIDAIEYVHKKNTVQIKLKKNIYHVSSKSHSR